MRRSWIKKPFFLSHSQSSIVRLDTNFETQVLAGPKNIQMYGRLLRLNTARGSYTGLVIVGPAKIKACKSVLFTKDIPEVEIKSTWLMKLTHFII